MKKFSGASGARSTKSKNRWESAVNNNSQEGNFDEYKHRNQGCGQAEVRGDRPRGTGAGRRGNLLLRKRRLRTGGACEHGSEVWGCGTGGDTRRGGAWGRLRGSRPGCVPPPG